jgi:hypothetical protein
MTSGNAGQSGKAQPPNPQNVKGLALARPCGHGCTWVRAQAGGIDESDRASHPHSCQSDVNCGHQVVVPFGYALHADRAWADGQAASAPPPRKEPRRRLHARLLHCLRLLADAVLAWQLCG